MSNLEFFLALGEALWPLTLLLVLDAVGLTAWLITSLNKRKGYRHGEKVRRRRPHKYLHSIAYRNRFAGALRFSRAGRAG